MEKLFELGTLCFTRGVNDLVAEDEKFTEFVMNSLKKHAGGDWGEMSQEDKDTNEQAVKHGMRIFSAYEKNILPKIWIITEADRSATTVLLPSEY